VTARNKEILRSCFLGDTVLQAAGCKLQMVRELKMKIERLKNFKILRLMQNAGNECTWVLDGTEAKRETRVRDRSGKPEAGGV
jgi:hypothetical protein